jgi:hypothetical protein
VAYISRTEASQVCVCVCAMRENESERERSKEGKMSY